MSKLTVTKIGEPKEKKDQYGTKYRYMVSGLINGQEEQGMMQFTKPENAPSVGQELDIEIITNDYGSIFKKINNFGNTTPSNIPTKTSGSYQRDYKAEELHKYPSFALSYSKDIVVAMINNGYYNNKDMNTIASSEEIVKEWHSMAALTLAWLLADEPVGDIKADQLPF